MEDNRCLTCIYLVTPPSKVSEGVNREPNVGLESKGVHCS